MIAFQLGFIVRLKPNIKNKWFRIVLGLIIGPPIAVCVAKVILILLGEYLATKYLFIPVFFFILMVLIKAAVMRAIAGSGGLKIYLGSLLMSILVIITIVYLFLMEFAYSCHNVFSIPVLIIILGVGYRLKAGINPLGELYIIPAVLIALFIEADLFASYGFFEPHQVFARLENPVYCIPLILLIPLIEVWPASLFVPKGKVEKAVILSTIAVIIFMANAFISTSIALSWLVRA